MDTPRRRETGRPPTAQFAPRAVYIQDGNATRRGEKVTLVRAARSDLISKARAGDGDAFRELTEPHRRELQVPCRPCRPGQVAVLILRDVLGFHAEPRR